MGSYWDSSKVIYEYEKNSSTKVTIELATRKGVEYVSFREWWHTKEDPETWNPGKNGIVVPLENFKELLNSFSDEIR